MLASAAQQSESATCLHIAPLFLDFLSILVTTDGCFLKDLLVSLVADSIVAITEFYCFSGIFMCCMEHLCHACVFECERGFPFSHAKAHCWIHPWPHSWQKHQRTITANPAAVSGAVMDKCLQTCTAFVLCAASVLAETQQNGLHTQTAKHSKMRWGRGRISS